MTSTQINAGLFRRLAALTYDLFLVVAIWFGVAGLAVLLNVLISGGEALPVWVAQWILFPALIGSTFLFYYWFWTHGGQSLGMRAWRLKVISDTVSDSDKNPHQIASLKPNLRQCALRFFIGFFSGGLGLVFCLFSKDKKSLQCKLSQTRVIVLDKEKPY